MSVKYRSLAEETSCECMNDDATWDAIQEYQEKEFVAFEARTGRRCNLRDVEPGSVELLENKE